MDMLTGQILIAVVSISWGIIVETWYVGRWTVFFNLTPLFVIMMTQDLGDFIWIIVGYTIFAILLSQINSQALRQLVGAKSYGTLTLSLALYSFAGIGTGWAIAAFIGFSILTYIFWGLVYVAKENRDYNRRVAEAYAEQQRRVQQQQYETEMRRKRQWHFQTYGFWPNW